jgi:hypothetical protein
VGQARNYRRRRTRDAGASRIGIATFFNFRIGSSFSARAFYSRAFFDLEVV